MGYTKYVVLVSKAMVQIMLGSSNDTPNFDFAFSPTAQFGLAQTDADSHLLSFGLAVRVQCVLLDCRRVTTSAALMREATSASSRASTTLSAMLFSFADDYVYGDSSMSATEKNGLQSMGYGPGRRGG